MFRPRFAASFSVELLFSMLLGGALLSAPAFGQAGHGRGRLSGFVVDDRGEPVESATVVLSFLRSLAESPRGRGAQLTEAAAFTTRSDKKGGWKLVGIASGFWEVSATKDGFLPARLEVKVSQIVANAKVTLKLERAPDAAFDAKAALLERASALFWQKMYAGALALYREAQGLDPEDVMTMLVIGDCLRESGDFDGALRQYRALADKTSADPLSKKITAMALTRMGEVHFKKGDLKAATRFLALSVEASPTDEVTAGNLGALLFEEGDADGAERYYRLALDIAPARPTSITGSAWSSSTGGRGTRRGHASSRSSSFSRAPPWPKARRPPSGRWTAKQRRTQYPFPNAPDLRAGNRNCVPKWGTPGTPRGPRACG
jgi:Flp pilus assembly protein TadD